MKVSTDFQIIRINAQELLTVHFDPADARLVDRIELWVTSCEAQLLLATWMTIDFGQLPTYLSILEDLPPGLLELEVAVLWWKLQLLARAKRRQGDCYVEALLAGEGVAVAEMSVLGRQGNVHIFPIDQDVEFQDCVAYDQTEVNETQEGAHDGG